MDNFQQATINHETSGHFHDKSSFKGNVRFFECIQVIYLPTRQEIQEAGLHSKLWYNNDEMNEFKNQTFQEVIDFIGEQQTKGRKISAREALKELYQPAVDVQQSTLPERISLTSEAKQEKNRRSETNHAVPLNPQAYVATRHKMRYSNPSSVFLFKPTAVDDDPAIPYFEDVCVIS